MHDVFCLWFGYSGPACDDPPGNLCESEKWIGKKLKEIEGEGGMGNGIAPSRSWGGVGATPPVSKIFGRGWGGYA